MQWYRKVSYMNSVPLAFGIGATIYALASQDRISVADRAEIATLSKRNQKKARTAIRKANEEAKQFLLKKGIVVVEPAKEMVDELSAAAAGVQAAMTGKVFSQAELDTVVRHRDEYRAKNTKPAKP